MGTIVIFLDKEELPQQDLKRVKELAPEMDLLVTRERAKIERVLADVEILSGWAPHDLVLKTPNLRWVQQWGAGADWLMRYPPAAEMDFILTNVSGLHAVPISEHILAFMFVFARGLHYAQRNKTNLEWRSPDGDQVFELAGKTVLVVGVGSIGARTAKLAASIGMQVIGIRRNASIGVEGVAAMHGPERLLDLLPEADFVVLTAPLNRETRGMIGERELERMKRSAYLINIGRGGMVDEGALVQALQEGRVAGAGLDVFETEPLPEDSPLWRMENTIITAHYAGKTPHYHERAMAIFLDNLERFRSGQSLFNVVDKELMY